MCVTCERLSSHVGVNSNAEINVDWLVQILFQVVRVYIGSFWAQPLLVPDNRKLFEAEEQDLFLDIQSLPRNAALRKLNDLIKRARLAKVSINNAWVENCICMLMPRPLLWTDSFLSGKFKWFKRICCIHSFIFLQVTNKIHEWLRPVRRTSHVQIFYLDITIKMP